MLSRLFRMIFLRITWGMYNMNMYQTPRSLPTVHLSQRMKSTHSPGEPYPMKSGNSGNSVKTMVDSIFSNPTVRENINKILRVLFQALIQEFYPYILMTLIFMVISFILLIAIFILLLWREK